MHDLNTGGKTNTNFRTATNPPFVNTVYGRSRVRIDGVAKGDGKNMPMMIRRESWKAKVAEGLRASGADLKQAPPPPGYLERELAKYVADFPLGHF